MAYDRPPRLALDAQHGAPRSQAVAGERAGGADPAALKRAKRNARSVAELCDLYLVDTEAGRVLTRRRVAKKASTIATDRSRIERHIKPLLGKVSVPAVTSDDIRAFMEAVAEGKTATMAKAKNKRGVSHVRGGKGTATRTVGLLGSIFTYAVRHRMRLDNPVRGVDGTRTESARAGCRDEYAALGAALRAIEARGAVWPPAVAVTRLLLLTGWRRGEAIDLRRAVPGKSDGAEIDLKRRTVTLLNSKTGPSMRPLSNAATDVLRGALANLSKPDSLVFPASRGTGKMTGYLTFWKRIAAVAKLPRDITPHTLRQVLRQSAVISAIRIR